MGGKVAFSQKIPKIVNTKGRLIQFNPIGRECNWLSGGERPRDNETVKHSDESEERVVFFALSERKNRKTVVIIRPFLRLLVRPCPVIFNRRKSILSKVKKLLIDTTNKNDEEVAFDVARSICFIF